MLIMLAMAASILVPLFAGIPIAASLGASGLLWLALLDPVYLRGAALAVWNSASSDVLAAMPLFILMGDLVQRTKIASRFYSAVGGLLQSLPGGLLHANIGACAIFAAVSGSSVATAATIGTAALPNLQSGGYDKRLTLGTLAAGGVLGILIPPSLPLIIYGALVEASIGRLFMAAMLPGVTMAIAFSVYVLLRAWADPSVAPRTIVHYTLHQRLQMLMELVPLVVLIVLILGGIYGGWTTTNEAAGLGVVAALIIASTQRSLTWSIIWESLRTVVRFTAMLMFIIMGAQIFSFAVFSWGITADIGDFIRDLTVAPIVTLSIIIVIYLILGMFIDSLSMMVLTIPVVHPIITTLGYDPVWFGVVLVILLEIGLITPPVGMNLFTIQAIAPGTISLGDVSWGSLPFVLLLLGGIVLLIVFPQLALWLPSQMF